MRLPRLSRLTIAVRNIKLLRVICQQKITSKAKNEFRYRVRSDGKIDARCYINGRAREEGDEGRSRSSFISVVVVCKLFGKRLRDGIEENRQRRRRKIRPSSKMRKSSAVIRRAKKVEKETSAKLRDLFNHD